MTDPFKKVSSEIECCICKNIIKGTDGHLEVLKDHPISGENGKVYCVWCVEDQELNGIASMDINELPLYMFDSYLSEKATKLAQNRLLTHNPNNPPKTELDIFLDANPI